MPLFEIVAIAAAGIAFVTAIIVMRGGGAAKKGTWIVPAIACALFTTWSLGAVLTEGLTGFWPEHIQHMWGNQIWFDLLLAISVGWFLIVPRAKALGMRLPLWLIFIFATGSIGVTAMLARLLYLQEK